MDVFIFLFASFFLLIGIYLMSGTIKAYFNLKRSINWYKTEANIIDCKLEKSSGYKSGSQYWVKFEYEYIVGYRKYNGTEIAFGYEQSQADSFHIDLYEKLAQKTKVSIWHDPSFLEKSVLIRRIASPSLVSFIMGLFFFMFSLLSVSIFEFEALLDDSLVTTIIKTFSVVFLIAFIMGFVFSNISNIKMNRVIIEEIDRM